MGKFKEYLKESRKLHKIGDTVYIAQKKGNNYVPIKAKVTGVSKKYYEIEIDGEDAGTFNLDQVYKDESLDEL